MRTEIKIKAKAKAKAKVRVRVRTSKITLLFNNSWGDKLGKIRIVSPPSA
jgi:hypothetical protein